MIAMLLALVLNLLPPVVVVPWVAMARPMSRAEAIAIALMGAAVVSFVWLASPLWVWIGGFWPPVIGLLLVAAILRLALRSASCRWRPRGGMRDRRVVVPAIVLSVLAVRTGLALAGRSTSAEAVALEWPFRDGTFKVIHGGSTSTVNQHHGVPAQRYALDVVAVNRFGLRARGLLPAALDRYFIFGMTLRAPCSGEVIAARDGLTDGEPTTDRSKLAGNFAAIHCGGRTVLLAHLKAGSLAVRAGDRVESGHVLGQVGSSGNSSEPHLHIQAVAGRVDDGLAMITTARGVPMTFSGRFLVRNDVVTP